MRPQRWRSFRVRDSVTPPPDHVRTGCTRQAENKGGDRNHAGHSPPTHLPLPRDIRDAISVRRSSRPLPQYNNQRFTTTHDPQQDIPLIHHSPIMSDYNDDEVTFDYADEPAHDACFENDCRDCGSTCGGTCSLIITCYYCGDDAHASCAGDE